MTAVVVPRCGRVGCSEDRYDPRHKHLNLGAGDRVVCEPKRPTAPGWTFGSPAATVVAINGNTATVVLDDGTHRELTRDLLTRWHTFRKRKQPTTPARKLPALSRAKPIDPQFKVEEPLLFGETT